LQQNLLRLNILGASFSCRTSGMPHPSQACGIGFCHALFSSAAQEIGSFGGLKIWHVLRQDGYALVLYSGQLKHGDTFSSSYKLHFAMSGFHAPLPLMSPLKSDGILCAINTSCDVRHTFWLRSLVSCTHASAMTHGVTPNFSSIFSRFAGLGNFLPISQK
jgi:hypothetical protein